MNIVTSVFMLLKRLYYNMNRLTGVFMILCILTAVTASDTANCEFYDTVDLTGIQLSENGSYTYKNVEIPSIKTGEYNYMEAPYSDYKPVDKHFRGCLCQVAKCVYLCCEPKEDLPNAYVNFFLNGSIVYMNALDEYIVHSKYRLSCDNFYKKNGQEEFTIQEDGNITIYKAGIPRNYSKTEYCLVPFRDNNTYYKLLATITMIEEKTQTKISFAEVLKSVSVFCMIMAISVYIYLPKFRTDYNNSCLCYFFCLAVSFTSLWAESYYRSYMPNITTCYLMGYCGYYMVMATFLWLLIINYDLWRRIATLQNRSSGMFRRYNIFVWSAAATLVAIVSTFEYFADKKKFDVLLRPGVTFYYCWVDTITWSGMIFLYGPILVILIINLVLSFVTAKRIYLENKENRSTWNTSESQTNVTNRANFGMFFRLFAISGIVWITEIASYLYKVITKTDKDSFVDLIPCTQGILLFFVTIWKHDVFKELYKKMGNDAQKGNTQATSSTSENKNLLSSGCMDS